MEASSHLPGHLPVSPFEPPATAALFFSPVRFSILSSAPRCKSGQSLLSGGLITPLNPKRHEDDQRSYEGGHDISQRDRHSVQPWGKPQHPKQQATNEGSDKTHAQISEEAKAFTIPKWSSAQRGFLREARQ